MQQGGRGTKARFRIWGAGVLRLVCACACVCVPVRATYPMNLNPISTSPVPCILHACRQLHVNACPPLPSDLAIAVGAKVQVPSDSLHTCCPSLPTPPSCPVHPHPALCSVAWQRSVVPGTVALLASSVLGLCGGQLQAVGDEAGKEALYRVSARLTVQQVTKLLNNKVMPTLHSNSGGCCEK